MAVDSAMRKWLDANGLGQYADVFSENDVDLDLAPELSDDDLKELGLTLGHRKRFLKAVSASSEAIEAEGHRPESTSTARDPNAGAATSVHVATAPELADRSGLYFSKSRPTKSSRQSHDRQLQQRLWDVSAKIAGINFGQDLAP